MFTMAVDFMSLGIPPIVINVHSQDTTTVILAEDICVPKQHVLWYLLPLIALQNTNKTK